VRARSPQDPNEAHAPDGIPFIMSLQRCWGLRGSLVRPFLHWPYVWAAARPNGGQPNPIDQLGNWSPELFNHKGADSEETKRVSARKR